MASVTIQKRSVWAPYISMPLTTRVLEGRDNEWYINTYGRRPRLSELTWEPWRGGVFIHYIGSRTSFAPASETDCRKKVASMFADHYPDSGDIKYNFLVCPHGTVYEGRGYQRGEANGGATIALGGGRELGRNTAFFSIQGMIGVPDKPTAPMLASMKKLIHHLRYELPRERKAGGELLPHKAGGWDTECPGAQLLPYAKTGSSIDPEPPAKQGSGATALNIVSRASWGARPPKAVVKVPASERTGFVVHYSAGPASQTVRQIQNYHMDSNGWSDIGYNFLVDTGGRIYEGRGWNNEGAHTTGYNRSHVAVCFIGLDGDATKAAKVSIRSLYEKANSVFGRTLSTTYHSALGSTSCPGNDLRAWVRSGMPVDGWEDIGDGDGGGDDGGVRSVASQQKAVNSLGYTPPLDVDGITGPKTVAGIKWLQAKVGVAADGIWGPATEAAYRAYTSSGGPGKGMSSVRSIASQQKAVNSLGYTPLLTVDGVYGPGTEAGVKWLQTRAGITADGMWGPATEAVYRDLASGDATWSDGGLTTIRSALRQQKAVNSLGHSPRLAEDGIFGPRTEAGVTWLQARVGVAADGLWGPDTEIAFTRFSDGPRLDVDGDFGPRTIAFTQRAIGVTADGVWGVESKRALQRHLNTWSGAGLTVDGDTGPDTVKALQRHLMLMTGAKLTIDGVWGVTTTKALQNALNQGRL
ncbi:peptidoglycan-binding protein [Streptomyces sp. NPDC007346]|uniref:peptidoglycan recognition protein family protein n=1 Tax=Streptomyces sp. NPDC007346 TaxID=3154682 RepID=UPI0034538FB7